MVLRYVLLLTSVPMMLCGGLCEALGAGIIPYELRYTFPVTWAIDYPEYAFFGGAIVFVLTLLWRPGKSMCVNDFRG
jgi:hypothetical protein